MASSGAVTTMCETVFEGLEPFEGNKRMLLMMALMEETQEDDYCEEEDDRLMSMIQSLEAELSSSTSYDDMEVGQVDDQDCSTSSSFSADYWDDNMEEVISASSSPSSSFDDEEMTTTNAWSFCAASSELYYDNGLVLENSLPQESTDVVF